MIPAMKASSLLKTTMDLHFGYLVDEDLKMKLLNREK
jgi:hypothetical protein